MVMRLSKFSKIMSKMYTDKMEVKRHEEVTNDDGTTGIQLLTVSKLDNVPCRISFVTKDYPLTSLEDKNPIRLDVKVFCDVDVDIKKGDLLIIDRLDDNGQTITTYKGISNLPYRFVTHQEIELVKVGEA